MYLFNFNLINLLVIHYLLNMQKFSFVKCLCTSSKRLKLFMSSRISSNGVSFDSGTIAENSELVKSHLKSRKSNSLLFSEIDKIAQLRERRASLIFKGDQARAERKKRSQEIGKLIIEGKNEEANNLKTKIEEYVKISAEADENLMHVDAEIENIILIMPNLLDDR